MFHSVTIIGYLGKDPVMRYTPSGTAVTNLSVASKDKDITAWFSVSVWDKQGEACNEYLRKGAKVFVVGTLQVDNSTGNPSIWMDKDGTPHTSLKVNASKVVFLSSKSSNEEPGIEKNTDIDKDIPF